MIRKFFLLGFLTLQALWAGAADVTWTYTGKRNGGTLVLKMMSNEIYISDRAMSARFESNDFFSGVFSSDIGFCISTKNIEKWSCDGISHEVIGYEKINGEPVRIVEVQGASKIYLYLSLLRGVVAISESTSRSSERMEIKGGCGYPYVSGDGGVQSLKGVPHCRSIGDFGGRAVILSPKKERP